MDDSSQNFTSQTRQVDKIISNDITIFISCKAHQIAGASHDYRFNQADEIPTRLSKTNSRTTALHVIQNQISNGLNENRQFGRTVLVALDFSKVFDMISLTHLMNDKLDTNMP